MSNACQVSRWGPRTIGPSPHPYPNRGSTHHTPPSPRLHALTGLDAPLAAVLTGDATAGVLQPVAGAVTGGHTTIGYCNPMSTAADVADVCNRRDVATCDRCCNHTAHRSRSRGRCHKGVVTAGTVSATRWERGCIIGTADHCCGGRRSCSTTRRWAWGAAVQRAWCYAPAAELQCNGCGAARRWRSCSAACRWVAEL